VDAAAPQLNDDSVQSLLHPKFFATILIGLAIAACFYLAFFSRGRSQEAAFAPAPAPASAPAPAPVPFGLLVSTPKLNGCGVSLQDLLSHDNKTRHQAERTLNDILESESDAISDSDKSDLRAELIAADLHQHWARELENMFEFVESDGNNVANRELLIRLCNDRYFYLEYRQRIRNFCNLMTKLRLAKEVALTQQDRANNEAAITAAFDLLLKIARLRSQISTVDRSSNFMTNIDLDAMEALAYQACCGGYAAASHLHTLCVTISLGTNCSVVPSKQVSLLLCSTSGMKTASSVTATSATAF
jgi:hypothetical protein